MRSCIQHRREAAAPRCATVLCLQTARLQGGGATARSGNPTHRRLLGSAERKPHEDDRPWCYRSQDMTIFRCHAHRHDTPKRQNWWRSAALFGRGDLRLVCRRRLSLTMQKSTALT